MDKTARRGDRVQARSIAWRTIHPLHHSKLIQDIADIVSQSDAPQAPVIARTKALRLAVLS